MCMFKNARTTIFRSQARWATILGWDYIYYYCYYYFLVGVPEVLDHEAQPLSKQTPLPLKVHMGRVNDHFFNGYFFQLAHLSQDMKQVISKR